MTDLDWDALNSRPFGSIIFADPIGNTTPLPEIIADGDLDVDCYFICWNSHILNSIKTEPILAESIPVCNEKEVPTNDNWFEDGSEAARIITMYVDIGALTGKAYNLSHQMARESQQGIYDSDAIAFGKAFKDTLDFAKHGNRIE